MEGNHIGALLLNQKAWRIDPYDTYIPNNIAREFYILGDYRDAVAWYNKTLAMESYNRLALEGRGMALDKMGDYIGALRSYNQLFDEYPQYPSNYIGALRSYNQLFSENVNFPDLLIDIGIVFSHMKDYSDAITAFDAALSVNSTDECALYDKALTFVILGDIHAALKNLDMALQINPYDTKALNEKALLLRSPTGVGDTKR